MIADDPQSLGWFYTVDQLLRLRVLSTAASRGSSSMQTVTETLILVKRPGSFST
jgi:hypothetical protein